MLLFSFWITLKLEPRSIKFRSIHSNPFVFDIESRIFKSFDCSTLQFRNRLIYITQEGKDKRRKKTNGGCWASCQEIGKRDRDGRHGNGKPVNPSSPQGVSVCREIKQRGECPWTQGGQPQIHLAGYFLEGEKRQTCCFSQGTKF